MKIHFNYFLHEYFRLKLLITFFIFSGLLLFTNAANHYVDKNAIGSNNGSTWTNAWTSFSAISWSSIQPGDYIYISGGIDSVTYTSALNISNKLGSPNNLITITKGTDAGHNGTVILDGSGSQMLHLSGCQYIKISHLKFKNTRMLVDESSNKARVIYLDSLELYGFRGGGGIELSGYNSSYTNVDSVFIRWCTLYHNEITNDQTDGIDISYAENIFILDNYIFTRNQNGNHCDIIQCWGGSTTNGVSNMEIARNILINNATKSANSGNNDNGLMFEYLMGTIKVHDNLIMEPNFDQTAGSCIMTRGDGYTFLLYNNTIVTDISQNALQIGTLTSEGTIGSSSAIKNNIFYSKATSQAYQFHSNIPYANFDNNLYYYTTGNTVILNRGGNKTLAQMQASGGEIHGFNTNPQFINASNDWHLQSGSPIRDAGATLGSPYNIDQEGTVRPQGSGYDIGSYEYIVGGNTPPNQPSNPVPANAAINQPVNLTITWSCSD